MRVEIFDVVAVGDSDQERIVDEYRVDLHIDVEFDESAVLFVGVGDKMHSGDITEGSFVVGIDFVNFESILKKFTVHQLPYYYIKPAYLKQIKNNQINKQNK